MLLAMPLCSGCQGCRSERREDEDQASLAEFTLSGAEPMPAGNSPTQTGIKPGHWFTLSETMRANRADHRGTLRHWVHMRPEASAGPSTDPLSVSTEESLQQGLISSQRPAVLPQNRTKRFDAHLLAAMPSDRRPSSQGYLQGQYASSSAAVSLNTGRRAVNVLAPGEYFFVVLTQRPERFAAWQTADWVRPPLADGQFTTERIAHYRLVFPKIQGVVTLPETMLDWTSTAVLLWDDVEPTALTREQWRAIIDWLHFGGRVIVNGPAAAGQLRRSSLAPFLPQQVEATGELDGDDVESLLRHWSVDGDNSTDQQVALSRQRAGRLMTLGPIHRHATNVPHTSQLLLALAAGRGRVVLSRFDLTSDYMQGWRSRDSFINAALLGRPPREHRVASSPDGFDLVEQQFVDQHDRARADPLHNTSLRLLSRDARLLVPHKSDKKQDEFLAHATQGVGGWRDDSDLATLAIETLRRQSGINIPPRQFVIYALTIYLSILVIVNFSIFRIIGRVEWAWMAVPVIGLVGAAWIARSASLDIGFARSHTEVAVLEMHAGHPRGHATRFIAIYNSLSRRYELAFDSVDAAAAPLGALGQVRVQDDELRPVAMRYGYDDGPILSGLEVASNRTRIFHAEQLVDVGGSLRLEEQRRWLRNTSQLDLAAAWVVTKDTAGRVQVANVGPCDAQTRVALHWSDDDQVRLPADFDSARQGLIESLARADLLPPGSTRLVALSPQMLPGMAIHPEPPQQTHATLVVAHLELPQATVAESGDISLLPTQLERRQRLQQEASP